jgi:hypothetical protein
VIDPTTIKLMAVVNLGSELGMYAPVSHRAAFLNTFCMSVDLALVNDTVELIHDPRFYDRMMVA